MAIETGQSFGKRGGWLGLLTAAVVTAWPAGTPAEQVLDVRYHEAPFFLADALDAVLAGEEVEIAETREKGWGSTRCLVAPSSI